jgi:hypothetical protein
MTIMNLERCVKENKKVEQQYRERAKLLLDNLEVENLSSSFEGENDGDSWWGRSHHACVIL